VDIRELREGKGLSRNRLAGELGISARAIESYENGDRSPTLKSAFKIARYFGMCVDNIDWGLEDDVLTPDGFKMEMRRLSGCKDQEVRHQVADNVMCDILKELGYEEGVRIFRDMRKWYS